MRNEEWRVRRSFSSTGSSFRERWVAAREGIVVVVVVVVMQETRSRKIQNEDA